MKRLLSLFALLVAVGSMYSQSDVRSLLKELPPVPENICGESFEVRQDWILRVSALKDKMTELQSTENWKKREATSKGKGNSDFFQSPEMVNKFQAILTEADQISTKNEQRLSQLVEAHTKGLVEFTIKYLPLIDQLNEELNAVRTKGGSIAGIKEKMTQMANDKCQDLSTVTITYLVRYRALLDELLIDGAKINSLQDQANRMMYASYNINTRYGNCLDYLIYYADALMKVYDDHPQNILQADFEL
ncbi:MAG: hypothetical protein WCR50_00970 [Proteiniphilum sp.]|jgi:hypothetical protein|nr:hypothetical protein [Proteiniphilum sp.]NCB24536.1 hypothetical protein [Bacteroidia bacterium]MDD2936766.1 hypothetical protein [Proteiniphilum sp.]MDD3076100.1 hypothetical protein [Proteiniphilum sp.]MDD3778602.1 hypothetical protein [Proteiniphilum sp.]